MNQSQRKVLFWAGAVVVVMLLFPPFVAHYRTGTVENCGYEFLLTPPNSSCTVDIAVLLVQWIAVAIVGAILWFALRDKQ